MTNGAVAELQGGKLSIETPSSRAEVPGADGCGAELRFRYLGPSAGEKPLASGELRRQIGIKLLARDTCNVLYAMWHIEPDARIAVSLKRNPAMRTHAECRAGGYTHIKPAFHVDVPRVQRGEAHVLRAELSSSVLTVSADGRVVWQGPLGEGRAGLEGPAGLRTDNARFELEYFARVGKGRSRRCP